MPPAACDDEVREEVEERVGLVNDVDDIGQPMSK